MSIAGVLLVLGALALAPAASSAQEAPASGTTSQRDSLPSRRWSSFLPLMGAEAAKRGIELPLPLGAGIVYYHLDRAIAVSDLRVGRNGAPPVSVSDFAQLSSTSNVDNLNLKFDAWILPFVNVYLIAGYLWNTSETRIDVSLPPLVPGGVERQRQMTVPTSITGSVGGVGLTLAGGYGSYFMTFDANFAQADLGFDDRFKAVVTSIRGGWNGRAGLRPLRVWANATDWNTFATATGTVPDPDGGSLSFQVDQGPAYRYTYGAGGQYGMARWFDVAVDLGTDGHGGWYLALVPVFRF